MTIIIDLIVIAILALSIFLGYKKGLIGVAFKILSFLIAIVITLILYRPVSSFIINNTNFAKNIENIIVQKLSSAEIENGEIKEENTDLPNIVVDYINTGISNAVDNTKEKIVETIAKELSQTVINLIVIISIFIITRLLLLFAKVLLEAVSELPIVKQFNEAGGIIYGILRGIILIYVILTIISLILPMIDRDTILGIINDTILTRILYNNNIILMFFFK